MKICRRNLLKCTGSCSCERDNSERPKSKTSESRIPKMTQAKISNDDTTQWIESSSDIISRIRSAGYPAEEHFVQTDDGNILTVHRIPSSPKAVVNRYENDIDNNITKPVVFLQHGLMCSSAQWALMDASNSLGYLCADNGFDVWMGNFRGNVYSRNHTDIGPYDPNFWKFGWDEMGMFDLPAMIDYILKTTGRTSIYYVGHSMGTTALMVLLSSRPEYNAKIKQAYFLAPVIFMGNIKAPVRYLCPIEQGLKIYEAFFTGEFFGPFQDLTKLTRYTCKKMVGIDHLMKFVTVHVGGDRKNFSEELLNACGGELPAGTSSKCLSHFAQSINSGLFRKYNNGIFGNYSTYGSLSPPHYDLKQVTAPITLFMASDDFYSSVTDVKRLADVLPNLKELHLIPRESFGHLDYYLGSDVHEMINDPILTRILKDVEGPPGELP